MQAERDGVGAERIRECLDAVLQQTQGAGPTTTHVTVPIAVMDDVARVLGAALAQRAARPGEAAASEASPLRMLAPDAVDIAEGMRPTLAPCPFCGRRPVTACGINDRTGIYVAKVLCADCFVTMSSGDRDQAKARERVRARWNDRLAASDRALAGARAVLRQVEWVKEPMGWAKCPCCGQFQPGQHDTFLDYHTNKPRQGLPKVPSGHAPGCALAAELAADASFPLSRARNADPDKSASEASFQAPKTEGSSAPSDAEMSKVADHGPAPAADTGGRHGG